MTILQAYKTSRNGTAVGVKFNRRQSLRRAWMLWR